MTMRNVLCFSQKNLSNVIQVNVENQISENKWGNWAKVCAMFYCIDRKISVSCLDSYFEALLATKTNTLKQSNIGLYYSASLTCLLEKNTMLPALISTEFYNLFMFVFSSFLFDKKRSIMPHIVFLVMFLTTVSHSLTLILQRNKATISLWKRRILQSIVSFELKLSSQDVSE